MTIEELEAALGDTHRAFVDTSTCIAYHSTVERAHPVARHVFDRIADPEDRLAGYLSTVTVAEMLVRPIQAGDHRLTLVTTFLYQFPNLSVIDADRHVAQVAAEIRARVRLALPDALLIATALLAGCEAIVTNDERWARRVGPLYPRFRWVYLGQ